MSGFFDGMNGRLSKTWRFWRSGKSRKTFGDLRRSAELELLPFYRFTWQFIKNF